MSRYLIMILLPCLISLSACQKASRQSSSIKQDEFIQVYFNQREGDRIYTDPYRHVERDGDDLEAIIIAEILTAKSTIDIAVHEFELPLIAQALVKSHRSGVEVRLILDNNYSRPLSELNDTEIEQLNQRDRTSYEEFVTLVDPNGDRNISQAEIAQGDALVILDNAGIPVIDDTADGSKGSGLMHHKFMVVDGATVIAGSANWTLSDLHGDLSNLETRGNANHILKINNAKLASLFTEEFDYMWGDNSKGGLNSEFGLGKLWRSPETVVWKDTSVTVQFSPTSTTRDWSLSGNGLIGQAIDNATDAIDLALFVFSEQEIANLLEQKQQQGVKIRGVFDPGFAFRYYSEVLDLLGVSLKNRCRYEPNNSPWQVPLQTIGVPQLIMGDKLHHKFASIDDKVTISGSQNWSEAANSTNDEVVIVIDNLIVANHFQQEFNRLYNSASLGLPQSTQTKVKTQQKKCKSDTTVGKLSR